MKLDENPMTLFSRDRRGPSAATSYLDYEIRSRQRHERGIGLPRLVRPALSTPAIRYLTPILFVGLALIASILLKPFIPGSIEFVFFLSAIVATAWVGGRGPVLLAYLIAPPTYFYFLAPLPHALGSGSEARFYILPFLMGGLAVAWMSSARRTQSNAKHKLQQNDEKFSRILANLPDIAWTADQNGRMTYISPKVEMFLGFTSREICSGGVPMFLERVHPDERDRVRSAIEELFRLQKTLDEEYRFQHKGGSWIWIHNRATPYFAGNSVLADGVIADISRRKSSEVEVQSKTAFLEAQANSTIDGILVVDAHGQRIMQNERFNELFRIPEELRAPGAEDRPLLDHFLTLVKEPDSFLATIQELYRNPAVTRQDEIELKDGTTLERYSSGVHGKDGQYYGRIWNFRDITDRKRREDTLRQLSAAVEQSPVSVEITDPQGIISYVNRRFTETTGYALEEVLGKTPKILNSGYSPREMYKELWTTILDGKEWRGEFRNRRKNGEMFWESATISPIIGADGKITHFLAVKEDVTDRRALESELRQAQKLEAIGQLAAGIAHEINTPIQYIGDNTLFLKESWEKISDILQVAQRLRSAMPAIPSGNEMNAEFDACVEAADLAYLFSEVPGAIDQSLDGIERVAKIVRAMKEFSHPGSEEKRAVDLNKAIEATVTVARNEYKYAADVQLQLDPSLPMVVCLAAEINQVLLNLVVNAAHAIGDSIGRNGPRRGIIAISTLHDEGFVEIRIRDTGTGIPEAVRDRIFEPFFTTKEVGKGTGQGLMLAQNVVVKKHSGRIWFETELDQGTTFFVRLPITGSIAS